MSNCSSHVIEFGLARLCGAVNPFNLDALLRGLLIGIAILLERRDAVRYFWTPEACEECPSLDATNMHHCRV
jgi:hypothetical protein